MKKAVSNIILLFTNYLMLISVIISIPFLLLLKLIVRKSGFLYLENFPEENAGYQYRAAKWAQVLCQNSFKVKIKTVISEKKRFDNTGHFYYLWISYFKKFWHIASSVRYKRVIVRREIMAANDYGYLFMERFLLVLHPNAILDFDDDLAYAKNQPKNNLSFFGKIMLEHRDKFNASLRLYRYFIVGSPFLADLITSANPQLKRNAICYIPTCVDYDSIEAKTYIAENDTIVLGWIGGIYNLYLLESLIPSLNRIAEKHKIKLVVIAGKQPEWEASFEIQFLQWSLKNETDFLKSIDIGLMPLQNNIESIGKCGFKLIQYMGLGIPAIATNIGINTLIVEDGVNGFLVQPDADWYPVLDKAIKEKTRLSGMGRQARITIEKEYSFKANAGKYMEFVVPDYNSKE